MKMSGCISRILLRSVGTLLVLEKVRDAMKASGVSSRVSCRPGRLGPLILSGHGELPLDLIDQLRMKQSSGDTAVEVRLATGHRER
jgi:hypothetical protein